jgi:hypothetical protein
MENLQYDQLFTALAKAQGEFGIAIKNRYNPHFKSYYTDLDELIRVTRPALQKYGLCIKQGYIVIDDKLVFRTMLGHTSGQFTESYIPITPDKPTIQSLGSCLTYLSRYSYKDILCIAIADDIVDNDGNDTDNEPAPEKPKVEPKIEKPVSFTNYERISKEQYDLLQDVLDGYPVIAKDLLGSYEIKSLSELPKISFGKVLKKIEEKKLAGEF